MKNLFIYLLIGMFVMSFASAEITRQQNTNITFSITSNFADQCVLTTLDTPDGINIINQNGTKSSQTFSFTILDGNFSKLGIYKYHIECTDGTNTVTENDIIYINLSGVDGNITLIIADIFLIFLICGLIYLLHHKYKNTDYKESDNSIGAAHNGNWGKTFVKTLGNNLMRNSFLWYYSLGWLLLIVLKDLVYNFNGEEIYNFFLLFSDIYSFGFFLVIIIWIGILIHHFRFITDLIGDLNLGVRE